ncbi:low temperature requirement protein A [Nonomuraea sp. NPDC050663]|uniref:low temperature requirement protein A n=1 Tax=Nonomuraea sp. NPDC050663 TaxID=3364370 RepID=UPI0037BD2E79
MSQAGERHASWLELFFDLVVVVAVAQLAHRLHHPGWAEAGMFLILFYAVWSVWVSYTLYANVLGDKARTRSLLIGMFLIAVMAAAIPEVGHDEARDYWFISCYIACRYLAAGDFQRSGTFVAAWPSAQLGLGMAPWIASFWFDPPDRYWLWALGAAFDIYFSVQRARRPQETRAALDRRMDEIRRRELKALQRGRRNVRHVEPTRLADLDAAHLGERLGLFVIIVLGEAVMQVVIAASDVDWSTPLMLLALSGFGLVVCLWWLTLQYGLSAVPDASERGLEPYVALPAHFVMTGAIAALAAGLGLLPEHPSNPLETGVRWALCGALAVYFLASAVVGLFNGADRRWIWLWALPTAMLPLLVGLLGGPLPAWATVACLLVAALWRVAYRPSGGASGPSPAAA